MIFDAFHICCQKVLPAVYDESLSYYEVVCKLVYAMQVLDKSMTDLEARMDVLDKISTELWPQFQAEVNATLQQYAKAYEDFQTGIEADISKFESDLETMNTNLTNSIKEQNDAIAAANAAQMALLTERLAQQDTNISQIQSTVEQNSQNMADLTMDVHDFIAQYSPPATINGLSPQFLITANAGASLKAVQGLIELTATADGAGKAVINVSNYGDWVVTSQYQGQTKSVTVSVDDVKQYNVNVEQAEKTYTFILNPIPNFADLPSIITESMFQISGPNGYSVTKPVQATVQSFSVPGPGEYSFDLKIANIYPDASSEMGYKAASITGAILYTTPPNGLGNIVMPDNNLSNNATYSPISLPYMSIMVPNDMEISVTSPVTVTDETKTMISNGSEYKFILWTTGPWRVQTTTFGQTWQAPTTIFDGGKTNYEYKYNFKPVPIPEFNSEQVLTPQPYTAILKSTNTTPLDDEYLNRASSLKSALNLVSVCVTNKGVPLPVPNYSEPGVISVTTGVDDDSWFNGVIIPAFSVKTTDSTITFVKPTETDPIFPLFISPDNTAHKAVCIPSPVGVRIIKSGDKYLLSKWYDGESPDTVPYDVSVQNGYFNVLNFTYVMFMISLHNYIFPGSMLAAPLSTVNFKELMGLYGFLIANSGEANTIGIPGQSIPLPSAFKTSGMSSGGDVTRLTSYTGHVDSGFFPASLLSPYTGNAISVSISTSAPNVYNKIAWVNNVPQNNFIPIVYLD